MSTQTSHPYKAALEEVRGRCEQMLELLSYQNSPTFLISNGLLEHMLEDLFGPYQQMNTSFGMIGRARPDEMDRSEMEADFYDGDWKKSEWWQALRGNALRIAEIAPNNGRKVYQAIVGLEGSLEAQADLRKREPTTWHMNEAPQINYGILHKRCEETLQWCLSEADRYFINQSMTQSPGGSQSVFIGKEPPKL